MYKVAILFIPLLSSLLFAADVNLENKNLDIKVVEPKQTIEKTKKDYEKKEDTPLKKEAVPLKKSDEDKESDLEFSGNVDINKDTKTIEGVNVNIGTKF